MKGLTAVFRKKKVAKNDRNRLLLTWLFDEKYYQDNYMVGNVGSQTPIEHYITKGIRENAKPCSRFDSKWYESFYKEKLGGEFPLLHFLKIGERQGYFISENEKLEYEELLKSGSFDADFYRSFYSDLKVLPPEFDVLLHYVRHGKNEGRMASASIDQLLSDENTVMDQVGDVIEETTSLENESSLESVVEDETGNTEESADSTDKDTKAFNVIKPSGYFDETFYLNVNPDVAEAKIDPLKHFCQFGWEEFRKPNKDFDTKFYLDLNEDVRDAEINPLAHWVLFGRHESRKINPYVDVKLNRFSDSFLADIETSIERLKLSGVFNEDYYLNENPDVAEAGVDAARHFVEFGVYEGRKPSSGFDVEFYLKSQFDICSKGMNPVEYYLEYGSKNNDVTKSKIEDGKKSAVFFIKEASWTPVAINLVERVRHFVEKGYAIKVVSLHAGQVTEYLKTFADVLVLKTRSYYLTTSEKSNLDFLIEFVGYDTVAVVCHDYFDSNLLDGLNDLNLSVILSLGSQTLNETFQQLVEVAEYSVSALILEDELGKENFLGACNFPSSKVFLESVSNYAGMKELMSTSGSVFEIINSDSKVETVFESSVRNNLLANNSFVNEVSLSHIDIENSLLHDFKSKMNEQQVVSFDVFDTLLERSVLNPHDVFSIVEEQAKSAEDIPLNFDFRKLRVAAETNARDKETGEEVNLRQIYDELQILAGSEKLDLGKISDLEKEVELNVLQQKPIGKKLFDIAVSEGKKIVLISDMYLDSRLISRSLDENGYDINGIALYVSCEKQATKHHGSLYELVKDDLGEISGWMHVGDNVHSDISTPKKLGLEAFYLENGAKAYLESNVPYALSDSVDEYLSNTSIDVQIASKFYGLNRKYWKSKYNGSSYEIGYSTLGPVFTGFLSHLRGLLKQQNYDKVFFVSRDGYFLKVAYDLLCELDSSLPKSSYLLSSRLMTYKSSFSTLDDILYVANKDYFPTTLGYLMEVRFNFSNDILAKYENKLEQFGFSSFDDAVVQHENHSDYIEFVKSCYQEIIDLNKENKDSFLGYVASQNIDENSLLVDIGYAGSLQKTLLSLLGKKIDAAYFVVNRKIDELEEYGLRYHAYIGSESESSSQFFKFVQLFELFFSATHPSISGVKANGNDFDVIYDLAKFNTYTNNQMAGIHKGSVDFVEEYLKSNRTVFESANGFNSNYVIDFALRYFKKPEALDCIPLKDVIFEDRFGANTYSLITRDSQKLALSEDQLSLSGVWAAASKKLSEFNLIEANEDTAEYCDNFDKNFNLLPSYENATYSYSQQVTTQQFYRILVLADDLELERFVQNISDQFYSYLNVTFITTEPLESDKRAFLSNFDNFSWITKSELADIKEEWCLIVNAPVLLEPNFIVEVDRLIQNESIDLIYVDEDDFIQGEYLNPKFKPDFSKELLLSQPYYMGQVICCKSWLAQDILKSSPELPVESIASRALVDDLSVVHIPKILFHNTATVNRKNDYLPLLEEMLSSCNIDYSSAFVHGFNSAYGQDVYSLSFADTGPEVAIIIPTKNMFEVLSVCLESLEKTTYQNYKVYIIDNDSDEDDILDYFKTTNHEVLRISSPPGGFSYSYVNNEAAKQVTEDYVLFLNNDVKVISPNWLSQMVGLIQIDGIGQVGAKLFYGNDLQQHVGITNKVAPYGLPAPSFKLLENGDPGYLNYASCIRNYSAMTAACMLTHRDLFLDVGGFDDEDFSVAYNDCDYGFKLTQLGYRNVVAANAELYHFEGVTRGIGVGNDKPSEESSFVRKYKNWNDPYYNPNLTIDSTDFSVRNTVFRTTPDLPLKCLMVSHNFEFEGAPLIQYEVAKALKTDYAIEPMAFSPFDGPLRQSYEELGMEAYYPREDFNLFSALTTPDYEKLKSVLRSQIEELKPNVIFANTILSYWAVEIAKEMGIPSIWVIHESEPPFTHLKDHSSLIEAKGKACMNLASRIVFVAKSTSELYSQYNAKNNFSVVHNGFDTDRVSIENNEKVRLDKRSELNISDQFVFICPGVVSKRKAQIDAIKAFEKLPERIQEKVSILIVGDRPSAYSDSMHEYLKGCTSLVQESIQIIGETSDIGVYYNAADAFLFTSHLESFPKVIQEAMYLKLPIVSTNTFGIKEQVFHGSSALLCDIGDTDTLSNNMQELFENEDLREALIDNALSALDKLPTYEEMVCEYNELIQQAYLVS